jgi:hypothetical protein
MMNALALIVGNANYNLEKDRLINAVNDARDFGHKLINLGFIVKTITDCNEEIFDREIRNFGDELTKFDVGLFYFSGHGLQIEGKNYLTSIDTNFVDDVSAKHTSIPLDEIIDYMQKANPIIKILILDACRNNPLPNQYRGVQNNGLAPINAPKGTIIAFSTSPGETAMDYGASGRNSIYTESLLNHIDDTNIPIEDFFKRVRTSVYTLSNGKQTSWEHTSLIGNFYFNSGQLIHSVELPYKQEYIADENFQSDGSDIDKLIQDLRSQNWYSQKSALERLKKIKPNTIDENSMFLLGRNILQTAIGGEYSAISIIKNLDSWLLKYSIGEINHVLNGILFEIYFNSKGQFRQTNFKNGLIDDIFILQTNKNYQTSFQFILKQLEPFRDFLYYFPTNPPTTLPIEIKFESFEYPLRDKTTTHYKISSIRYSNIELLNPYDEDTTYVKFDILKEKLFKELTVPKNMLRISMNIKEEEITQIHIPFFGNLLLNRNKN